MATIKEEFGQSALELAVKYDVGVNTVYSLRKKGLLARAIKRGTLNVYTNYKSEFGKSLAEIAMELRITPQVVCAMHRLGVLQQAFENAKKLQKSRE